MRRFGTILLLLLLAGPMAWAADKVAVRLVPERLSAAPGETVTVAVEQKIAPGWHTYWSNPGEAGFATAVRWSLPQGWKAGPIQWPFPKREPVGPLMDYGYEGTVWLLVDLTVPKTAAIGSKAEISAHVLWLACREVCVPEEATVQTTLFVDTAGAADDGLVADHFTWAHDSIPAESPWPVAYARTPDRLKLFVAAPVLTGVSQPRDAHFFPARAGLIVDSAPQKLVFVPGGFVVEMVPNPDFKAGKALDGVLVLHSPDKAYKSLAVSAHPGDVPGAGPGLGLPLALIFAFLGGLILNVMPCVLPVLAMKALSIAKQSQTGYAAARAQALAYCLGAILSFVLLGLILAALRAGGDAVGWGFQLQQPPVVAGLGLLLLAVGLNLSGVFEVGTIGVGDRLTHKAGLAGAFFTGVLAVAVAAPCTAPLMAPAIGFGLTQAPAVTIGVFAALGCGFVLPFFAIGLMPRLHALLPKPGVWMVTLKHWLAVPMYAAAAWLIWVLSRQIDRGQVLLALAGFAATGAGLWLYGRTRRTEGGRRHLATALSVVAVLAAVATAATLRPAAPVRETSAERYTPDRLADLRRQNRPVFVDVNAAWCISCIVNEQAAIDRPAVRRAFAEKGIVLLKADWTRRDPEITLLLESHYRSGVPLYLYYPKGSGEPKILPQILTEAVVLKAIAE